MLGTNWRMSEMQAAVGLAQLRQLPGWVLRRQEIASRYLDAFSDQDWLELPVVRPEIEHAWHLFVVQVDERERFMGHLAEQGVASGIHYPIPCHRQPVYADHPQHAEGTLPYTERICERIVSIPIHPLHTEEEIKRVVKAVCSYR